MRKDAQGSVQAVQQKAGPIIAQPEPLSAPRARA